ncbi:hypothetical protein AM571_PC00465 (plasmid) [Rhizobium etli 8C-3]|uniref:Uncharacterized protein n=1 Tax=Rhizobium etli 8C-3 TaxID=538025 RepID=A0A1L5PDJ2_RHIET|nr:hypothetical protein AM571_PC00465 [Rhizobium etli 8C-3]
MPLIFRPRCSVAYCGIACIRCPCLPLAYHNGRARSRIHRGIIALRLAPTYEREAVPDEERQTLLNGKLARLMEILRITSEP